MPYIKKYQRNDLADIDLDSNITPGPSDPGELNYVLTKICHNYFLEQGGRYQQVNDILGALEGAKLEFYRRVAAPYEDTKIKENGDVYV